MKVILVVVGRDIMAVAPPRATHGHEGYSYIVSHVKQRVTATMGSRRWCCVNYDASPINVKDRVRERVSYTRHVSCDSPASPTDKTREAPTLAGVLPPIVHT